MMANGGSEQDYGCSQTGFALGMSEVPGIYFPHRWVEKASGRGVLSDQIGSHLLQVNRDQPLLGRDA